MPITVANRTYNVFLTAGTSSSFAIPSTTAGNLLLVLVTNCAGLTGDIAPVISDNVGDSFTQVPWYSLAGSNAIAGQMSKFAANAGHGGQPGDCGQFDAWYATTKGSATAINWAIAGDVEPEFWVYELTGLSGWTLIAYGATVSSAVQALPFLGPAMNSATADNAYFSMVGGSGGFQPGGNVGPPWSLDPSFQVIGAIGGQSLAYIVDGTGTQQAAFGGTDTPDAFVSVGVVFGASGYTVLPISGPVGTPITVTPGFPTPITITVGGTPVTPIVGNPVHVVFPAPSTPGKIVINGTVVGVFSLALCALANSVWASKYSLGIAPLTQKLQNLIPVGVINLSDTTNEGRDAFVLDFNNGDGLYSVDIGTAFAWPLAAKTILRVWQPALIPMPENQYNRPTDWDDGGKSGNKFIQGITIEADSFNLPKTFQLQSADDLSLNSLNEVPATFPKQTTKTFSCVTPFLAHSVRILSTDGVAWRVWRSKIIFKPWPSQVTNWQTEMTSLGIEGWGHAREMNVAYASANPVTLILTFDAWPTITIALPSSGGSLVQSKLKVTLPVNKWKLVGVQLVAAAPFYVFEQDLELKIKKWGSTGAFSVVKVIGGQSSPGAEV